MTTNNIVMVALMSTSAFLTSELSPLKFVKLIRYVLEEYEVHPIKNETFFIVRNSVCVLS